MPRVLRPAAAFGLVVIAVAIAVLVLGRFVLVPMLARSHTLVDANLARALAGPIHLRLAEIGLAATLVAFVVLPKWTRSRLAAALALALVAAGAAWRAWLLPQLYAAWSKVDLVAARPLDRLRAAEALDQWDQAVTLAMVLSMIAMAYVAMRGEAPEPRPAAAPRPQTVSGTIVSGEPITS